MLSLVAIVIANNRELVSGSALPSAILLRTAEKRNVAEQARTPDMFPRGVIDLIDIRFGQVKD